MANYTVDPNTGIKIPTPGVDPGEDYAVNISNALTKLSSLTHTGASNSDGLQIPSAGLNINADLSMQSNNLTNSRSLRLNNLGSNISGSGDINCLYDVGGNLWFNNGSGTQIQITAGSVLDSPTGNAYSTYSLSGNTTIGSTDIHNFYEVSMSTSVTITLPTATSVAPGRFYIFHDKLGVANNYSLTVQTSGGDTINGVSSIVLSQPYGTVTVITDGSSTWAGVLSGEKTYASGETLTMNSGSIFSAGGSNNLTGTTNISGITLLSGTTTTVTSSGGLILETELAFDKAYALPIIGQVTATSGSGYSMLVSAQDTSASGNNGGNLILRSGAGAGSGVNGEVIFEVGNVEQVAVGNSFLAFLPTVTTPNIGQTVTTSGNANNLTISAQTTTAASANGGNLTLNAGGAPNGFPGALFLGTTTHSDADGYIGLLQNGVSYATINGNAMTMYPTTTGCSFQITPWVNVTSLNTQQQINQIESFTVHTATGSGVVYYDTITIPNNCIAKIDVSWVVKSTSGTALHGGNNFTFFAWSDGSGSVSNSSGLSNWNSATGTYLDSNSYFTLSTATNSISMGVYRQTASALDWQFTQTLSIN